MKGKVGAFTVHNPSQSVFCKNGWRLIRKPGPGLRKPGPGLLKPGCGLVAELGDCWRILGLMLDKKA